MSRLAAFVTSALCAAALFASVPGLAAQQPISAADSARLRQALESQLGAGGAINSATVISGLQRSGLSREQVHQRLQQMGYDPSLADPYFDAMQGQGEAPASVSPDFIAALSGLGVMPGGMIDQAVLDSLRADSAAIDSALVANDSINGLPIFGMSLFDNQTTLFQPLLTGPVDPDYRLGPGDRLTLILTGDVQQAYTLDVLREGYVVIPDVGRVFVSGLTLGELRQRLFDRLSQVYSGIRRGVEASTHFDVSLDRLRANQVFVMGEAVRPGALQISAAATVMNALYHAGGPERSGSFRSIEVRRDGRLVRTIDLYDYLLNGDSRDDIRLQQGDIVFVPLVGRRASIQGAVRRPAVYEMKEREDLHDLVRFAGGLQPDAVVSRVQIDRIVPPGERGTGVDRVLVDVPLAQLRGDAPIPVYDGDQVRVFAVSSERRHRLIVTGEVQRPGLYEWSPGETLWNLIQRADGLREDAYRPRAQIYRLEPEDGSRRMITAPLLVDSAGRPHGDVTLADRDSVVVLSREELSNPEYVTVDGFVKRPGTYQLAQGMTVQDLILAAGGFTPGADPTRADVARRVPFLNRTDTTAQLYHVSLTDAPDSEDAGDGSGDSAASVPDWVPSPADFRLEDGDHVFIRRAPGYEKRRTVVLTGEVMRPGTYVLSTRQERLTQVVAAAGGMTKEAYLPGLRLVRDSMLLATDLPRALESPGSHFDLVLESGDSLYVPRYDPSVRVIGAVGFPTSVLYEPGKGMDYYIRHAGGYADNASKNRVTVTYQDGARATTHAFLGMRRDPKVLPGSTIHVPEEPASQQRGLNLDSLFSRTLTLITIILALQKL